jgi:hypothetical protein
MENKVVVISHSIVSSAFMSIHKKGCKDIARNCWETGGFVHPDIFSSVDEALTKEIEWMNEDNKANGEPLMEKGSWEADQFFYVFPCARSIGNKDNFIGNR